MSVNCQVTTTGNGTGDGDGNGIWEKKGTPSPGYDSIIMGANNHQTFNHEGVP